MKIIPILILSGLVSVAQADLLLQDFFDDGDLATSSQLNGGFYEVDNGQPKDGTSEEAGGHARLINGSQNNITGLLSTNKVNLLSGSITTWDIRDYEISNVSSYIAVTWQTSDTYTPYPELSIIADLTGNGISFFEDGTNTIEQQDLTLEFDDFSGFSLIATFDEVGYTIEGFGVNLTGGIGETNIVFSGNWSGSQHGYGDLFQDDYHVGTFINGKNPNGAAFNIKTVSVVSIPEPAVITLVGISGGCFLLFRRLFRRNT